MEALCIGKLGKVVKAVREEGGKVDEIKRVTTFHNDVRKDYLKELSSLREQVRNPTAAALPEIVESDAEENSSP